MAASKSKSDRRIFWETIFKLSWLPGIYVVIFVPIALFSPFYVSAIAFIVLAVLGYLPFEFGSLVTARRLERAVAYYYKMKYPQ